VDVDCLFTGKVEEDDSSLVTVSGCMDSKETTLSIASILVPDGIVDLHLELADGSTYVIKDDEESMRSSSNTFINDIVEPPRRVFRRQHRKKIHRGASKRSGCCNNSLV